MILSEWLKAERERLGMTQAVAAAKANTTLRTWCRWETDARDWSPAQWRQAACALGKSTREADTVFAGLVLNLSGSVPLKPYPAIFAGPMEEMKSRAVNAIVATITSKGTTRSYVSVDGCVSWHLITAERSLDGGQ